MEAESESTEELAIATELSREPVLETNDLTAITKEQQDKLNQHKVKTRIENELYLRNHPEISALLSSFISEALIHRPENVPQFAAEYFTDPALESKVKKYLHDGSQ